MTMTQRIDQLTPEQEALIPVYREKWQKIARSTERIDQEKAREAIREIYVFCGKKEPKILFFDSPHAALELVLSKIGISFWSNEIGRPLSEKIEACTKTTVEMQIRMELDAKLGTDFIKTLREAFNVWNPLEGLIGGISHPSTIQRDLDQPGTLKYKFFHSKFCNYLSSEEQAYTISLYDFCISVLNCNYCPKSSWSVFQKIADSLYWIFPYENICFTCDRPRILL